MSRRSAIALALTATVALAFYGHEWVALPKQQFAGIGNQAEKNRPFLSGNNAWCITRQLQSGQPSRAGRIHVAWTEWRGVDGDSVSSVFTRYTDDFGVTWSDPHEFVVEEPGIQPTDSARDIAIACLSDTLVVAFYHDYSEEVEEQYAKRHKILLARSTDGGVSWVDPYLDMIETSNFDHFGARRPSVAITHDEGPGDDTTAQVAFIDSCRDDGVAPRPWRCRVNATRWSVFARYKVSEALRGFVWVNWAQLHDGLPFRCAAGSLSAPSDVGTLRPESRTLAAG